MILKLLMWNKKYNKYLMTFSLLYCLSLTYLFFLVNIQFFYMKIYIKIYSYHNIIRKKNKIINLEEKNIYKYSFFSFSYSCYLT